MTTVTRLSRLEPFWGPVGMPLNQSALGAVGFLIGDAQGNAQVGRGPVGTFFVVSVPEGDEDWRHVFMVTALHVVMGQNRIEARMRDRAGNVVDWPCDDWVVPEDESLDLAVARFAPPPEAVFTAIPIAQTTEAVNMAPKLGGDAYFPGLLSSIPQMGLDARPVVRRATVAATWQSGVQWDKGAWTCEVVHLIDSLSYEGFSGSPCFIQADYPVDRRPSIPDVFWDGLESDGIAREDVGDTVYFGALWGIFVAHTEVANIGIVIPIEYLSELLRSPDVEELREMGRKHDRERKAAIGFKSQGVEEPTSEEFRRFEDLARKLVQVPKEEVDELREGL